MVSIPLFYVWTVVVFGCYTREFLKILFIATIY